MKTLFVSLVLSMGLFIASSASAQVHNNVGMRNGHHADYYYLPDIDMYYYIPGEQFVYFSDNHWIFSRHLPSAYHDYDFAHGRRIYVNGMNPYMHHDVHIQLYGHENGHHEVVYGYGGHGGGHGNSYGHGGGHGNNYGHGGGHGNGHGGGGHGH